MTTKAEVKKIVARLAKAGNAYEVLGVLSGSNEATIKAQHRALASVFHPDRSTVDGASAYMAQINVAYSTLMDKKERRVHDMLHGLKASTCSWCSGKGKVFKQQGFKKRVEQECPRCEGSGAA